MVVKLYTISQVPQVPLFSPLHCSSSTFQFPIFTSAYSFFPRLFLLSPNFACSIQTSEGRSEHAIHICPSTRSPLTKVQDFPKIYPPVIMRTRPTRLFIFPQIISQVPVWLQPTLCLLTTSSPFLSSLFK